MKRVKVILYLIIFICMVAMLESCNPVFKAVKRQATAERKTEAENPVSVMITQDMAYGGEWLAQKGIDTLTLTTKDGVSLKGYYMPAIDSSKKTAVLIHGYGADARMMAKYGQLYRSWGYNVFMADNRGHGQSGGNYVGMGWLDRLDYLQWIDLLFDRYGNDKEVVIHGISMGASAALMISGEAGVPEQVKAIVADCGFTNAYTQFKYLMKHKHNMPAFPLLHLANRSTRRKAGYSLKDADALGQVKKAKTPILIIHGDADQNNPLWMGQELYAAAAGPKRLLIVPGARHAMSYHYAPDLYSKTIAEFLSIYVAN